MMPLKDLLSYPLFDLPGDIPDKLGRKPLLGKLKDKASSMSLSDVLANLVKANPNQWDNLSDQQKLDQVLLKISTGAYKKGSSLARPQKTVLGKKSKTTQKL